MAYIQILIMSLLHKLARVARSFAFSGTSSYPQLAYRAAHTININLNIGQDARRFELQGLDTGKIIINPIEHAAHLSKLDVVNASPTHSFEKDLLALNTTQLQHLLEKQYGLCELAECVKKNGLTGNSYVDFNFNHCFLLFLYYH